MGVEMYNKKDLISVIVPVYNIKEYLERCVDSILAQTWENLEILLVDDGSFDGRNCWRMNSGKEMAGSGYFTRKTAAPPRRAIWESGRQGGLTSALWTAMII